MYHLILLLGRYKILDGHVRDFYYVQHEHQTDWDAVFVQHYNQIGTQFETWRNTNHQQTNISQWPNPPTGQVIDMWRVLFQAEHRLDQLWDAYYGEIYSSPE